jgi:predicted Fe-S protein YdhL (DUF1289 family)
MAARQPVRDVDGALEERSAEPHIPRFELEERKGVIAKGPTTDIQPASPCVGVCRLDPVTRLCLGCRRTAGEIMRWPGAGREEKLAILAKLGERRTSQAS